jgi:hypothetical protein
MADPNLADFYSRVARFEDARSSGYGFDAAGTLGRSAFAKPAPKRRSFLPLLAMMICAGFLLKGVIYHSVGAASYNDRVAALMKGEGFDRLGGWLMQSDPVTIYISGKVEDGLLYLRKAARKSV